MNRRPSLDDVGLLYADVAAMRGTCSRLRVGAVITDERGVVLSSGYNGALAGQPHCSHVDDTPGCPTSVHAEENAILWAARRGVAVEGMQLYCTHSPCILCARMVVQTGLVRLVYDTEYRNREGLFLLFQCGIQVQRLERIR